MKRKNDLIPLLWQPGEIEVLEQYYSKHGANFCETVILNRFGWTRMRRNIIQKARKLGIKYQGPHRGVFHKGHVPLNKGKKMSIEVREKVERTMFKKGHLPANTKKSTETIVLRNDHGKRREYYIRLSIGKWEQLSRHTWRSFFGEIPDGFIVTYKDGNSLNCKIENLELISRKQNLERNQNRIKFKDWHYNLTDEYVLWYAKTYLKAGDFDLETARANRLIDIWRETIKIKRSLKKQQ